MESQTSIYTRTSSLNHLGQEDASLWMEYRTLCYSSKKIIATGLLCQCHCRAPGVLCQQVLVSITKWQILVSFQDPNLTLFTRTPDLSDCFQQTVLLWTPAATLWICSVFYIPYLLSLPPLYAWRDKSIINILKMVRKWFSTLYSFLLELL